MMEVLRRKELQARTTVRLPLQPLLDCLNFMDKWYPWISDKKPCSLGKMKISHGVVGYAFWLKGTCGLYEIKQLILYYIIKQSLLWSVILRKGNWWVWGSHLSLTLFRVTNNRLAWFCYWQMLSVQVLCLSSSEKDDLTCHIRSRKSITEHQKTFMPWPKSLEHNGVVMSSPYRGVLIPSIHLFKIWGFIYPLVI